jgi:DNA-binding NarL/FixJ family response regulator
VTQPTGDRAVRVAILDDHRLVADGLASVLREAGLDVVISASNWAELISSSRLPVDVTVMDLHLGDGILIETKVRALNTMGTATVVISRHADRPSIASVMRAGALAFVAKADPVEDLVMAIRTAATGKTYLAPHRAPALSQPAPSTRADLGPREERALVLYAGGRSIREVAADMQTTEETVKSYIKRGRRKYRDAGIDLGTRILLRSFAVREGWLSPE